MKWPRIVENWRAGWRWFSNWCFGAAALVQTVWLALTPDERALVPESWAHWITLAITVMGVVTRFIKQKPPAPCAPAQSCLPPGTNPPPNPPSPPPIDVRVLP